MTTITETLANGITVTHRMTPCATCSTETSHLSIFPGNLCLGCYEKTPAARQILTATELANLFR